MGRIRSFRGNRGTLRVRGNIGGTGYFYGYPAHGSLEPNVAAQWLFDEASGDIVDEVSGITLADSGSPTYNNAHTGLFAGLSPGIAMVNANPPTGYFSKAGADSNLDIGTGDFTVEAWVTNTVAFNGQRIIDCRSAATDIGWELRYQGGADQIVFYILTATTERAIAMSVTSAMKDGNEHKIRVKGTRAGNLEMFYDGASLGTATLGTLVGQSVVCNNIFVASQHSQAPFSGWSGQLLELRVSMNATNNSGGPGGG